MSLRALPKISQYSDGDDLWVFADIKTSKALQKMDWFLNFQLQNPKLNPNNAQLIYSHKKLPTMGVLSIPFNGDILVWCQKLKEFWAQLGHPKIRVFAPDNITDLNSFHCLENNLRPINVVLN